MSRSGVSLRPRVEDVEQIPHLLQLEAQRLHALDEVEPVHVRFDVEPEAALAAGAGHHQADFLVVADGAQRQPGAFGHLAEAGGGRDPVQPVQQGSALCANVPNALPCCTGCPAARGHANPAFGGGHVGHNPAFGGQPGYGHGQPSHGHHGYDQHGHHGHRSGPGIGGMVAAGAAGVVGGMIIGEVVEDAFGDEGGGDFAFDE